MKSVKQLAWIEQGQAYRKVEEYDRAIALYRNAIKSGEETAHLELGDLYQSLKKFTEARFQFQIALYKGRSEAQARLQNLLEGDERQEEKDGLFVLETNPFGESSTLPTEKTLVEETLTPIAEEEPANEIQPPSEDASMPTAEEEPVGEIPFSSRETPMSVIEEEPFRLAEGYALEGKLIESLIFYQQALDANDKRGEAAISQTLAKCESEEKTFELIKAGIRQEVTECYYHLAKFYEQHEDYPNALMAIRRYNRLTHKKYDKGLELLNVIFSHL